VTKVEETHLTRIGNTWFVKLPKSLVVDSSFPVELSVSVGKVPCLVSVEGKGLKVSFDDKRKIQGTDL
jgi:hypothetical protein